MSDAVDDVALEGPGVGELVFFMGESVGLGSGSGTSHASEFITGEVITCSPDSRVT